MNCSRNFKRTYDHDCKTCDEGIKNSPSKIGLIYLDTTFQWANFKITQPR